MRFDDFNPHHDPVARELHELNARLRSVNDQLWEQGQPAEVRAMRDAARGEQARVTVWGVRAVFGLVLAWGVLSALFGAAGSRVLGGALAFGGHALGVLLVVGFFLFGGRTTVWRSARALVGRSGWDR